MKIWHKALIGVSLVLALPIGATAVLGSTRESAPRVPSIDLSGHARSDDGSSSSDPEDISGPCDEAEHATDPRCTGEADGDDDSDNSGPGSDNSGPGSDNSGSGSSNSGSGSSGGNSGPGGG